VDVLFYARTFTGINKYIDTDFFKPKDLGNPEQ
jgi:hypothetical protein